MNTKIENRYPRVVALLGNRLHHKSSLSTYLEGNLNIVGAVFCDSKTKGIPLKYIFIRIKKVGIFKVLSQIFAFILYQLRNKRFDEKIYRQIFRESDIYSVIESSNIKTKKCFKFSEPDLINWISELKPDILVCHTSEWVPKKVRAIPSVKYVIGGHPGITQSYRGAHSPFWAIYNRDKNSVGWTTFFLTSGVDAGEIIDQGRIKDKGENSFFSLSWIGMREIALSHVRSISLLTNSEKIKSNKNSFISDATLYDLPGVFELIRYWLIQNEFR